MATETRYGDSRSAIAAGCADPTNMLGAPDGTYTTNGSEGTNWTELVTIGDPTDPLTSGATDHSVTVTLRKNASGGNGNPTCNVNLYDNGTFVRSLVPLGGPADVTDATTTLGPFTFTTAEVSSAANVQIAIDVVGQGGAPAGRRNVQVDGITVAFNTTPAGTPATVTLGSAVNGVASFGATTVAAGTGATVAATTISRTVALTGHTVDAEASATVTATTIDGTVSLTGHTVSDVTAIDATVRPATIAVRTAFGLSITSDTPGGGPVALVNSTASADANTSTVTVAVPSGAASGHIAILSLEHWGTAPTITWPTGFTQIGTTTTSGSQRLSVAWKRLTGADTGNYVVTLSTANWSILHCVLVSGAVSSGDPIEDFQYTTAVANQSVTTSSDPFLIHTLAHENAGTYTQPTSYTVLHDVDFHSTSYRIPGSSGTFTSSGAAFSGGGSMVGGLIAIEGAAAGGTFTGAIVIPFTVSGTASFTTPSVVVDAGTPASVSPAVVACAVSFDAATIEAQASATVTATTISGTTTLTAPTVQDVFYPYVTAASANGRYLVDQNGDPVMNYFDTIWPMVQNAGRDSAGDWQADMDLWVDTRSAQGFTGIKWNLFGSAINGAPADLLTHDNISPFDTNDPTTADISAFNETYWQRVDYLIDAAAASGMTCWIHVAYKDDVSHPTATGWLEGHANADYTAFGTALGNRYKNKPNIVWVYGGDYFDESAAQLELVHDAIAATGDTHLVTVQNMSDSGSGTYWSTSRYKTQAPAGDTVLGNAIATVDGLYIYARLYEAADQAYNDTPTLPIVFYDGYYDGGDNLRLRRDMGWALTSGAYAAHYGDEGLWDGDVGWKTGMSSTPQLTNMMDVVAGYDNWHTLVPDWNDAFITAGRGTGTSYVTGAKTADGKLAIIYNPNANNTITVDTTQMAAGYTVTWVDPANGSTVAGSQGTTFQRTVSNSASSSDWFLVLEAPPDSTVTASTINGSSSFGAATVAAGQSATVTATTADGTAALTGHTVVAGQEAAISATTVDGIVSLDAVSIVAGQEAVVSATTVDGAIDLTGHSVSTGAEVTATTIDSTATLTGHAVSAGGGSEVTATTIDGTATLTGHSIAIDTTTSATTIDSVVALDAVTITAGQEAAVTAVTVDGATTLTGHSVTIDTTASAATIDGTAALDAVSVTIDTEAAPTTIAGVAALDAVSVTAGGGTTATPATLDGTVSLDAASVLAGQQAVVSASTVDGTVSLTGHTVDAAGNATVTATTIDVTASLDAVTVDAGSGASVSATTIDSTSTFSGTAAADVTTAAVTIDGTAILDSVTIASGSGAEVTATTIDGATTFDAVSITYGGDVEASTVGVTASLDTPSITAGGSATSAPSTISRSASFGAHALSAGARYVAAAVTVGIAIGGVSVLAGESAEVTPSTITASSSVGPHSVSAAGNVSIAPSTIAGAVAFPSDTLGAGVNGTPPTLSVTTFAAGSVVGVGYEVPVAGISLAATLPSTDIGISHVVVGTTVQGTTDVPSVTVTAEDNPTATPATIQGTIQVHEGTTVPWAWDPQGNIIERVPSDVFEPNLNILGFQASADIIDDDSIGTTQPVLYADIINPNLPQAKIIPI